MPPKQTFGSRAQVMHGNAKKTSGGLTKSHLKYNKQGKIVSRKASALAKKNNRLVKAGYVTRKGEFGVSMRGGTGKRKREELTITHFDYIETIGTGAFGYVNKYKLKSDYIDTHFENFTPNKNSNNIYAIKIMRKNKNMEQNLKKEAEINMMLNSDYIIKCYGYFSDSKYYYIILELCIGEELWSIVKLKTYEKLINSETYEKSINFLETYENLIYKWVFQILLGLHEMHNTNVAWRDMKLENIMICGKNKDVKLIDFGFSMRDSNKPFKHQGTPDYLAPELINFTNQKRMTSVEEGKQTDIFAFGIIMCELFTKINIISGESISTPFLSYLNRYTINQILNISSQPSEIFKFGDNNKTVLANIIENCVRKEPSERWDINRIIETFNELPIIDTLRNTGKI